MKASENKWLPYHFQIRQQAVSCPYVWDSAKKCLSGTDSAYPSGNYWQKEHLNISHKYMPPPFLSCIIQTFLCIFCQNRCRHSFISLTESDCPAGKLQKKRNALCKSYLQKLPPAASYGCLTTQKTLRTMAVTSIWYISNVLSVVSYRNFKFLFYSYTIILLLSFSKW